MMTGCKQKLFDERELKHHLMNHREHVSSPTRYLKVVDGDKIWEEGQDVLDLQQVALVQKLHGSANVFLILHHMAS